MTTTMREFRLPDLGEGVHEGQVLRLCVAEGEHIDEDQVLMEVETDKAAVEIPCPVSAAIERWHVAERQVVNVGDLMVTFATNDKPAAKSAPAPPQPDGQASRVAAGRSPGPAGGAPPRRVGRRAPASPAVRKLARQRGVDLESVVGSGPGGRIVRADVEAAARGAASASASAPVRAPVQASAATAVANAAPPLPSPARLDGLTPGGETREPLTRFRLTVAEVMSEAARTIPHVTDCDDADVTTLETMRRAHNASAPESERLGALAFLVAAVSRALRAYPIFNASFDADAHEVVYHHDVHIAIGVQTERGLVAPVLRNVERLDVRSINAGIAELVTRARTGSFQREETQGGTYTISNAGAMGGSRYATPIITPPQVAVLAAGRTRLMPWVVDGAVVPRRILPLSHSMDHRLIDGAVEIAFMRHVIGDLENPLRLFV